MMRDAREGRSGRSRKSYIESKEMHQDKEMQMKELEKYMQELTHDITEEEIIDITDSLFDRLKERH